MRAEGVRAFEHRAWSMRSSKIRNEVEDEPGAHLRSGSEDWICNE